MSIFLCNSYDTPFISYNLLCILYDLHIKKEGRSLKPALRFIVFIFIYLVISTSLPALKITMNLSSKTFIPSMYLLTIVSSYSSSSWSAPLMNSSISFIRSLGLPSEPSLQGSFASFPLRHPSHWLGTYNPYLHGPAFTSSFCFTLRSSFICSSSPESSSVAAILIFSVKISTTVLEHLIVLFIALTVACCSSSSRIVGASQASGPFSTLVQHLHTVLCLPRLFQAILL